MRFLSSPQHTGHVTTRVFSLAFLFFLLSVSAPAGNQEDLEILVLKEDFGRAVELYGSGVNLRPEERYLLGVCYLRLGELKTAQVIWEGLLSGPEEERGLLALAAVREKSGELEESATIYRRFIRQYPESPYQPVAILGLGNVLEQQGRRRERLELLKKLRQFYPFSLEAGRADTLLRRAVGPFTIQLGSFDELHRAVNLRQTLTNRGYDAYLLRQEEQVLRYRVRVGNFPDRQSAETFAEKLRQEGFEFFIPRNP